MIDALRVCYEVVYPDHIEQLKTLNVGERYDFYDFHLYRVEGKRFDNVYAIRYHEPNEGEKTFGHLKFNIAADRADEENNKVWLWVENWVFYDYMALNYLPFIVSEIGLEFHNITSIDLCMDLQFNVPQKLRRLLKRKDTTTILNGKRIRDRDIDRPEITYTTSGSLNKMDRYMTVNIKQRKAMKDKARGITLTAYDKIAEINNSSNKEYIRKAHGFPDKLYRLEIHLNNAEIKEYWGKYGIEANERLIFDQQMQTIMFLDLLNSIVRFDTPEGRVDWEALLGRHITTTPVSDYVRAVNRSK